MKWAIKTLAGLALVGLAIYLLDVDVLLVALKKGSPMAFALAVGINLLSFAILALRWDVLIQPVIGLPFRRHLAIYFQATFLNAFTPANLGGDAYRLLALKEQGAGSGEVLRLLVRERVMGLYGFVATFLFGYGLMGFSSFQGTVSMKDPYAWGLLVALAVLFLPLLARPLGNILGRLPWCRQHGRNWAAVLSLQGAFPLAMLTFCGIGLWILTIKVTAHGFGLSVSLVQLAVVATLVEVIRLIPISIQGIGLREGAFAYLLASFGHNPEQSFVVGSAAYLALSLAIVLAGPLGQLLQRGKGPG